MDFFYVPRTQGRIGRAARVNQIAPGPSFDALTLFTLDPDNDSPSAMARKPYYAVANGRTVGVFTSWYCLLFMFNVQGRLQGVRGQIPRMSIQGVQLPGGRNELYCRYNVDEETAKGYGNPQTKIAP